MKPEAPVTHTTFPSPRLIFFLDFSPSPSNQFYPHSLQLLFIERLYRERERESDMNPDAYANQTAGVCECVSVYTFLVTVKLFIPQSNCRRMRMRQRLDLLVHDLPILFILLFFFLFFLTSIAFHRYSLFLYGLGM